MEKNYFNNYLMIYIVDTDIGMCNHLKDQFNGIDNVEVVNMPLHEFLNRVHVDAIVTPGNSFGLMTGGFDKAVIDYFGNFLMEDVQNGIKKHYLGEQPVGTSLTVPFVKYDKNNVVVDKKYLIHIPTMRVPMKIIDNSIVYTCMRSALIACNREYVHSVVIPAFGGLTGGVDKSLIAKYMFLAYHQLTHIPNNISWESIIRFNDDTYKLIKESYNSSEIKENEKSTTLNSSDVVNAINNALNKNKENINEEIKNSKTETPI